MRGDSKRKKARLVNEEKINFVKTNLLWTFPTDY